MEKWFEKRNGPRESVFFGFDWEFALTDSGDFPAPETVFRPVQLPHDWSVEYDLQEDFPSCGSGFSGASRPCRCSVCRIDRSRRENAASAAGSRAINT